MGTKGLTVVGKALDEISWVWLEINHPQLAEAIQEAVEDEITPEEMKRFVMQRAGRYELALRCEQAARWLETNAH